MLQFNSTLYNSTLKLFPYWRLSSLLSTSVVNPETSNVSKQDDTTIIQKHEQLQPTKKKVLENTRNSQNNLSEIPAPAKTFHHRLNAKAHLNNMIKNAESTEDLIGIMKSPGITIDHVRHILSLISSKNADERGVNPSINNAKSSLTEPDIKKVDLDSSKMIPLATPSLIQVLKKLSYAKDRNVPLLRTLAHNITTYSDRLNIKMCGDILYSLCTLNYVDEDLLNKVMLDLFHEIPRNKKGPVLGSIATSIGLLRYKHCEVLDVMCKWTVDNHKQLRVQDFIATLQCFATFGYNPLHMSDLQQHIHSLNKQHVKDNELWLDFVWSLTILGKALPSHVSSVLDPAFVKNILKSNEQRYMSKVLKLLNINGAAQVLVQNYDGPLLDTKADIFSVHLERKKQRQELVELLDETLKQIAPSHFQTNVSTKMGFFIDAECCLNSNNEFINISETSNDATNMRLAMMLHDYHDYSRGKQDLLGVIHFYNRILPAKGYKVLNISYHNFSINDKLVKRVKYLNEQIRCIRDL